MPAASLDSTFGAAFFGISASSLYEFKLTCRGVLDCRLIGRVRFFCCSIFGILSMQCYTYYHRYPLDRPFYKILVRIRSGPARGSFSHQFSFRSIRWECYGSYWQSHPVLSQDLFLSPRLLEATHSALISHFFYHYVIVNWGKTLVILTEPIIWSVISCSWDSCKTIC